MKAIEDITLKNNCDEYDEMILGKDPRCVISMDCHKTQLNNNVVVIGGSGSGKTSSITNPMLLNIKYSNIIGIFTKRGIIDIARADMERRGYKTYMVDFSNPKKSTIAFDPLLMCENDTDVRELARCIVYKDVQAGSEGHDIYWDQTAETIIYTVLKYVWAGKYKKGKSMIHALNLLDKFVYRDMSNELYDDDIKCPQIMISANEDKLAYPLHYEFKNLKETIPELYTSWKSFLDLPETTAGCVVGTVQSKLQTGLPAEVRNIFKGKYLFNLDMMLKKKQALFVMMSPVSTAQYKLVEILYRLSFKGLFERAERKINSVLPYPVHFICDDFATGCHVPNFPEMISIFREKRISVTLLIQSETQLAAIYGKNNATTIINNCDTYIFMGGMDLETCENISRRLNISVQKILYMKIGKEIFIRRGMEPFFTERYNYLEDEVYQNAEKYLKRKNTNSKIKEA